MYEENVQYDILKGNLGVFKGGVFENVIAQILSCNEMPIYYYRRDNRLEIDFVTIIDNKIVPIEVKAGTNTKSESFNNVLEKENIEYGIKLSLNNVNCSNSKIKRFPLYLAMFIGR
jgi:predicted AAA+ superfamily ATPase